MRFYLVGTLIGLIAIALLNYFVDANQLWYRSSALFERSLETNEVRIIRSVAGSSREERLSQFALSPTPDMVLMGSSPSVQTSKELFSPKIRFFNLGVSGGSIEEYAAFWLAANELKHTPHYLVILLEPNSFNASMGKGPQEWLKESGYFEKIYKNAEITLPTQSRTSRLINKARLMKDKLIPLFKWESFESTLQYLLKWGIHPPPDFEVVKESDFPEDLYGFRSDGSMVYPKKIFKALNVNKVDEVAALMPDKKTDYLYLNYSRSENQVLLLKSILKSATLSKVKVMLVVHPLHPATYEHMLKTPEYASIIEDSREVLKQIRNELPSIRVCDVLNPAIPGCTHSEFMDAYHYLPACDRKMINYCFSSESEWVGLKQNMVLNTEKN